ncbi:hypothetical protein CYLTODRAFT_48137 [Cylindrobasidium torrendii FP15055 ss-10]|uniref:Uncharacterized protein n=1 Tax=Cylindrobasidium torrendii FP15055 ss-10 TaxID=1314674 RepID=A0A0D7B5Y9_9AGAR|nr:hypothetical protein CYLTODRAFT_48137 [Cylindrobasidium torrendii FP15055 ss-10]
MYLYHFIYSSEQLSETGQCSGRSEACGAALGAPPTPMIAARVESDSSQHVGRLESDSDSTHGNTSSRPRLSSIIYKPRLLAGRPRTTQPRNRFISERGVYSETALHR